MPQTRVALPALRRSRTKLQAHSPLHAHALVEATEVLTRQGKRSLIAGAIQATLAEAGPVSALDIAATGLPLGAVLAEVGELANTGALRVCPSLTAGDPAAAKLVGDLGASAGTEFDNPVSMKIAVSGPSAHAVVESLGHPHLMEGVVDRLPGHTPRPWGFTRLASGAGVVFVVADTAAVPGEEAWFQLLRGALGVVVTVDSAYPVQAEEVLLACQRYRLPHMVAVLDGHPPSKLVGWARSTLPIDDDTPVMPLNLGDRASALGALAMLEKPCLAACATNDVSVPQDGGR